MLSKVINMNEKTRKKIMEMHKKGMTTYAIAKQLGLIIGLIIALVYIAPMVSMSQYPISMQVFYPNHPNITITQNCTGFTTSESGYLNGQPINETNTTTCYLPQNMAPDDSNPFNCNISNKSITCSGTSYPSVTWQGTILNVSKR